MRRSILLAGLALIALALPSTAANVDERPAVSQANPDSVAGKKAVEAQDWKTAIRLLSKAAERDDFNADVHNLLGFSYRHDGNFEQAFKHYNRALSLNPQHRGAHEYIGVAFLLQNNLAKAEEHLAALNKICQVACEEQEDLKKEIDAYKRKAQR